MTRIAIVGGGIAGLSIAWAIRKRDPRVDVVVLEGAPRTGGNVRTKRIDGYLCEAGPDGFLDNAPETLRLVNELGLSPRLMPSNDAARKRYIFRGDRLHPVPTGPGAFLTSGILSIGGKLRLAFEPLTKASPDGDESIFGFAARHIGHEAASVLVDSMVSGIYAGDSSALSLRACFPRMWQLERDHGSLFRAALATRKQRRKEDAVGAPAGRLTSFTEGMTELLDGLTQALGSRVRTGTRVMALREHDGYTLQTSSGILHVDAVVLAGPSSDSAHLIKSFDSTLAGLLSTIPTAPIAVACLGYDEAALTADRGALDGFGFLVPRQEGVRILGALWETSIYTNRAPAGKALLRVMIGGARDPRAIELSDEELVGTVRSDLRRTMGLSIAPEFVHIVRHARGIPQYVCGHPARLHRIDTLLQAHPGLFLAGNSYRGVSMNACIAEADGIAARVIEHSAAMPELRLALL